MTPMVAESDYLHMKAEVERLTAELAERDEWLDRYMRELAVWMWE